MPGTRLNRASLGELSLPLCTPRAATGLERTPRPVSRDWPPSPASWRGRDLASWKGRGWSRGAVPGLRPRQPAASAAARGSDAAGPRPLSHPPASLASAGVRNAAAGQPGAPALLHRPGESRPGQRPCSHPGLVARGGGWSAPAAGLGVGSDV